MIEKCIDALLLTVVRFTNFNTVQCQNLRTLLPSFNKFYRLFNGCRRHKAGPHLPSSVSWCFL